MATWNTVSRTYIARAQKGQGQAAIIGNGDGGGGGSLGM